MKKTCKVSGTEFEITTNDLEFYKKMGVPEPSLCPEERQRRRLAFRNERKMYHRDCDATGKKIISHYSIKCASPIYETNYWWSDEWSAIDYGKNFNFNKSFFEQFQELRNKVPRLGLMITHCENCEWSPYGMNSKDCYLSISCIISENVA